ncbi:MAG: GNAT family N-acetyltransferase [Dehalococcoidales bacterium]
MAITIKLLEANDIPDLADAFLNTVWKTPASHFERMLAAQIKGEIVFLVAHAEHAIAGFVFIKWQADYPPFAEQSIPEIRDLRVLAEFRRRGIATALMDEAEKRIFQRSKQAGLGVGLYADYGPAQRMYILRGYIPDGHGLMYNNHPVSPGHDIFVDDALTLFFVKERK